MIHFSELRIVEDGSSLIIDVSVDNLDYYKNVFLDSVIIDTQDTYVVNGPSIQNIYTYEVEEGKNTKHIRLELQAKNLGLESLDNNLYFVYVTSKGDPEADASVVTSKPIIMGPVSNLYPYFQSLMDYVKEIECKCSIPKHFIDGYFKYKALELCLRVGNYPQAIKYWNRFFKYRLKRVISSNCGCYG